MTPEASEEEKPSIGLEVTNRCITDNKNYTDFVYTHPRIYIVRLAKDSLKKAISNNIVHDILNDTTYLSIKFSNSHQIYNLISEGQDITLNNVLRLRNHDFTIIIETEWNHNICDNLYNYCNAASQQLNISPPKSNNIISQYPVFTISVDMDSDISLLSIKTLNNLIQEFPFISVIIRNLDIYNIPALEAQLSVIRSIRKHNLCYICVKLPNFKAIDSLGERIIPARTQLHAAKSMNYALDNKADENMVHLFLSYIYDSQINNVPIIISSLPLNSNTYNWINIRELYAQIISVNNYIHVKSKPYPLYL